MNNQRTSVFGRNSQCFKPINNFNDLYIETVKLAIEICVYQRSLTTIMDIIYKYFFLS